MKSNARVFMSIDKAQFPYLYIILWILKIAIKKKGLTWLM